MRNSLLIEASRRMVDLLDRAPEMQPPVLFRALWRERETLRHALELAEAAEQASRSAQP